MKLKDYLKESREKCSLTQAEASEKIGTTINTIQNWEYGKSYPERNLWNNVINVYNLDKDKFKRLFMDLEDESLEENPEDSNYLEFIKFLANNFKSSQPKGYKRDNYSFKKEFLNLINLKLTKEEMELLILKEIYKFEIYGDSGSSGRGLQNIPYEYVKEIGMYNLILIDDSLREKMETIGDYYKEKIITLICKNNGNINTSKILKELISINNFIFPSSRSCKKEISDMHLLDEIKNIISNNMEFCLDFTTKDNEKGYNNYSKVEAIQTMYKEFEKYIALEEIESIDEEYLAKKEKYEKALEMYKDGFIDKMPKFEKCISQIKLTLTEDGKKFIPYV